MDEQNRKAPLNFSGCAGPANRLIVAVFRITTPGVSKRLPGS